MVAMNRLNRQFPRQAGQGGRKLGYRLDKTVQHTHKTQDPTAGYTKKTAKGDSLYVTRIALTGGPCAGKSSSMESLRNLLISKGYDVYFAPEVPTIMMNGGCKYPGMEGGKESLMQFEMGLINLQLQVERTFTQVATSTGRPSVVIMDRGVMDIKAYLPEDLWNELLDRLQLTESTLLGRYDLCLHLVTAAHGAENFYTLEQAEGVSVRSESPEQARVLDDKMRECWGRHPNHAVVDNSSKTFELKLERVNDHVMQTVQALTRADLAASFLAKQLKGKAAEETFKALDTDGSGYIDAAELQEGVKTFGMEVSKLESEMLVKDLSGKIGKLGLEQFRSAVARIAQQQADTAARA